MGDKNDLAVVAMCDVNAKVGHSILKSAYVTVTGDRTFDIVDGTTDCDPVIFTISTAGDVMMPYVNHPMRDGLRVEVTGGTTGELTVIYE